MYPPFFEDTTPFADSCIEVAFVWFVPSSILSFSPPQFISSISPEHAVVVAAGAEVVVAGAGVVVVDIDTVVVGTGVGVVDSTVSRVEDWRVVE